MTALLQEPSALPDRSSQKALHIMHAVLSLDVGGLERVVLHLAREAQNAGHRVSILCLERSGVLGEMSCRLGIEPIVLGKRPGLTPALVTDIRRVLRELRPDVLHTHQIGALLYAGRAARREKIPVILHTEHINNIAKARGLSRRVRTGLLWWFASRYADRFCCVSQDIADTAVWLMGRHKLRVIRNGIPVQEYDELDDRARIRASLGIAGNATVFGMVARLSEEKSQDLLIHALAQLPRRDPPVHLLLVGDGPAKAALMTLAAELGISSTVHFAGYQPEPRLYLQAMDIFVLSSRVEGMPLAILEAWAARLPVIATSVGGVPDLIQTGENGLLIDSGDQSALQAKLLVLLQSPELRRQLGENGRRCVESQFPTSRMAGDYYRQYSQVLSEKRLSVV